jgi:PadR family transcriptional regulator, regulatory protein PadR
MQLPKLSDKEFLILDLLIVRGEMYGLQLVEEGNGKLARGTVYVTLQRMGEKGFVSSRAVEDAAGGLPRRLYKPTGHGAYVHGLFKQAAQFPNSNPAWAL